MKTKTPFYEDSVINNFKSLTIEMNDAIGVLTKNNDYAKSSISAFLVYKNGRSKMQTLNCNEDCFEGNFKGKFEVLHEDDHR